MATFVSFLSLTGADIEVNADEVFALSAVPAALLQGIPDGTYIQDEGGSRVAVQGKVLVVAGMLAGTTVQAQKRCTVDAVGVIIKQAGVLGVQHIGPGEYLVSLDGGAGLVNQPALATPTFGVPLTLGRAQTSWNAPDVVKVLIDIGGIPADSGFSLLVAPTF